MTPVRCFYGSYSNAVCQPLITYKGGGTYREVDLRVWSPVASLWSLLSQTYTMTPTRGLPSGWYKYLGIAYLPRDNLTLETCYEIHDNLYDQIEHTREQFNF